MRRGLLLTPLLLFATLGWSQSSVNSGGTVTTTGAITAGHCAKFASGTVIQDAGGGACSGGGGSGTVSPGTTNKLPKYTNGAGATVGDSLASDDGTTFLYGGSGGLSALSVTSTGTASPDVLTEQAAPTTPSATLIDYWADSTDHRVHDKSSGGTIGTTVVSDTGAANNFLTGVSAAGVISKAQPSSSNLSDGATLVKESGNLTSGVIPKASGTATVVDSLVTDDGTTLGYSGTGGITVSAGPIKSASDGTHAGRVSLSGNTTAPTLPTNSFSILGPNSAAFTAFAWQPPTAENGAVGLVQAGAASSHVSALTIVTALPNGMTATTQSGASNDTKVATDAYVDAHFIANGTAVLNTASVASGACETVVTVGATGVATTDVIQAGFNGDPTAVTGYGASATGAVLTIYPYPTANNVNIKVCNSTASSITPSAMTLNWKVSR